MDWLHCDRHKQTYLSTSYCTSCEEERKEPAKKSLENKIQELEEKLQTLSDSIIEQKHKNKTSLTDTWKVPFTEYDIEKTDNETIGKIIKPTLPKRVENKESHGTMPKGFTLTELEKRKLSRKKPSMLSKILVALNLAEVKQNK